MSNVFNEELQKAIKTVYSRLESTANKKGNEALGAKINLYYAHGARDKTALKLATNQKKTETVGTQLKEATKVAGICRNIVTAATAAATDGLEMKSATSTAVVNIQTAANALTDLSADVAAILAVASSKDYGSKIQQLASMAQTMTAAAAEKAEDTILQSLQTTMEAAQSRASETLTQAKTLEKNIISLTKMLDKNFESLQAQISEDSASLTADIVAENDAIGRYKTALEENKAMTFSETFMNEEVNYDLRYIEDEIEKGEKFSIAFNHFEEEGLILKNGKLITERIIEAYHIIFTEKDDAAAFDIQAAKATNHYFRIDKLGSKKYEIPFVTSEAPKGALLPSIPSNPFDMNPRIAIDYKGNAIRRGIPYVVFVYVKYNNEYQNLMNNSGEFLSLSSLPFTLLMDLPKADTPLLYFYKSNSNTNDIGGKADAMRVSFNVNKLLLNGISLAPLMDFRVLLFNQKDEKAFALNIQIETELKKLFDLDEKYRLSEQEFLNAELKYNRAVDLGESKIVIEKLKSVLKSTKITYENQAGVYNAQQEIIMTLNKRKKSNFFLDSDVLNTIPEAFSLNAKKVDQRILHRLKEEDPQAEANSVALSIEKKELEKGQLKGGNSNENRYVAINENGDFTDNYGEPLVNGEKYTALVYSVIKATEVDALPLFQPVFSSFSEAKIFDLPQL